MAAETIGEDLTENRPGRIRRGTTETETETETENESAKVLHDKDAVPHTRQVTVDFTFRISQFAVRSSKSVHLDGLDRINSFDTIAE